MKSKAGKVLLYVIVFVMLISFLMRFDFIAEPVAAVVGTTKEAVKDFFAPVIWISVGALLIYLGAPLIAAGAIVLGGICVVLGIGFICAGLFSYFKKPEISKDKM